MKDYFDHSNLSYVTRAVVYILISSTDRKIIVEQAHDRTSAEALIEVRGFKMRFLFYRLPIETTDNRTRFQVEA